ncbi:MAG: TetR family transcriptional regulator C-terminal domain-containing protein, partial [Oscillospiraceae bacterium]|nr:TetR family transcriptional regulator C-terminal domain-containing protein [Oscillospiraceae bacterium]
MDYVEKNDYLINCAYDSLGRDYLKNFFCSDFVSIVQKTIDSCEQQSGRHFDPEFKEFASRFFTEALAGMLIETVKEKDPEKRRKLFLYLTEFIGMQLDSIK